MGARGRPRGDNLLDTFIVFSSFFLEPQDISLLAPGGHVHWLGHDYLECSRKLRFRPSRLAGTGSTDHVPANQCFPRSLEVIGG